MKTTATLRLSLFVTYDLNGTPVADLVDQLNQCAEHLADVGLLSAEHEAEVAACTHEVTELDCLAIPAKVEASSEGATPAEMLTIVNRLYSSLRAEVNPEYRHERNTGEAQRVLTAARSVLAKVAPAQEGNL